MPIEVIEIPLDSVNWEKGTSPAGKEGSVNIIYGISTPYGAGIEINTKGNPDYGFDFFARTKNAIQVPGDGKLNLNFIVQYYDTSHELGVEDQVRYARMYILETDGVTIKAVADILRHKWDSLGGNKINEWYNVPMWISLTPYSYIKLGLGRRDAWSYDYQLTLRIAKVTIHKIV
jgi:hypothetical protein